MAGGMHPDNSFENTDQSHLLAWDLKVISFVLKTFPNSWSRKRSGDRLGFTFRPLMASDGKVGKTIVTLPERKVAHKTVDELNRKTARSAKNISAETSHSGWERCILLLDGWYGFKDIEITEVLLSMRRYLSYLPHKLSGLLQALICG
jgi:hypothetical protein